MDHDKSSMKSETEGKGTSGANSDHSSRLCSSEEDYSETNPAERNAALGITQPYFVADTLEDDDDSLIIPPTQEDSAPLMIPNTPVLENRSKSTKEVDLDASTVSVLEETCVDLEDKSDHNDSTKEGPRDPSTSYSCIENDFTQDLDLEPTQPIILSRDTEEDECNKGTTDASKKDEDEDQDDEWQLRFSETQTQDLLNFEKENEDEKGNISGMAQPDLLEKQETKSAVDVDIDDDDDDDDLPATLSIEVPNRMGDLDYSNNEPKGDENPDIIDIQSDDEIEPSQSCLSDYKGETISASFKPQGNSDVQNDNASVEEIPKLSSEAVLDFKECAPNDTKDSEIVVEKEIKMVNLCETEPQDGFTGQSKDLENKSLSIEEISLEDVIEDKEVPHNNSDAGEISNDVNSKEDSKLSEKEQIQAETLLLRNEEILCKQHENSSVLAAKVSGAKEIETVETNGESGEEIQDENNHKISDIDIVNDLRDKEFHLSNLIEEKSTVIKSSKPRTQELKEKKSVEKSESVSKDGLEYQNKTELKEISIKDTKSSNSNSEVSNTETAIDVDESERVEVKDSINKDSKVNDTALSQKVEDQCVSENDKLVQSTDSPVPVIDLQSNVSEIDEIEPTDAKQTTEAKAETPPIKLPTLTETPSFKLPTFTKRKSQNKVMFPGHAGAGKSVSSFLEGMEKILDKEKVKLLHSNKHEEIDIKLVFSFANQMYYLKEFSIESEHHRDSGRSPVSSGSTLTSSTNSSKATFGSGDIADIDTTSSSAKSSCAIQTDLPLQFLPLSQESSSCAIQTDFPLQFLPLSQESDGTMLEFPKTSTQKTSDPVALSQVFKDKAPAETSKVEDSPAKLSAKSKKGAKSTAPKRKRGGKKNSDTPTVSGDNEPKQKRARATKAKAAAEVKSEETTDDSKDLFVLPKKPTRKKKGAVLTPDREPEEIKSWIEKIEITTTEDDATTQEEANFGSILPGVKVMARWKDGYYYSGMVEKQESDGKWAVRFEDGFVRPITLENLIKIAILPIRSSVLVQSADDYYDPGVICGHFKEGNKVGYEVELDNGVTRRYPRSAVILSGDQAKLIISTRPPTTPATMTINLDNIIDGKRKRKSVQTPASSPVVAKKSPRITRSKKADSNLESTADSSAADVALVIAKDSESEEPAPKKRKGKATKATKKTEDTKKTETSKKTEVTKKTEATKKTASTSQDIKESEPSTVDSSNVAKANKVLPQRSAKKLFKDYAFLLSNADRKVIPKAPDASDSDIKEEEDIVPFDKDELCEHIKSGGGVIIEKFEDIKKCHRKNIYLLANSYLRTMKYIQCIAAGISCIKHHWVQNCVYKAEILGVSSYILPSGYSMVSQKVIEWHGKTDVFKGCKIALVSAPENPFVYTWAPVLLAAKADFVQKWSLPTSVSGCPLAVDVLITNHHCPPDIIQSAKKKKIPIVSSEWIIHCLIEGKPLLYDAHPKFKYDYTEK